MAEPGDFRTAFIGETPIVVARDEEGANCAAWSTAARTRARWSASPSGATRKHFSCIYHSWTYHLDGRLRGVAFRGGLKGKGGMPEDFDPARHRMQPIRVEVILRPRLRHLRAGHAIGRGVGGPDHGAFPQAQSRRAPAEGARHPQPDHPQQLEALRGECARFLPRHPAAHLLHHLQGEPAGHGRRHPALRKARPGTISATPSAQPWKRRRNTRKRRFIRPATIRS